MRHRIARIARAAAARFPRALRRGRQPAVLMYHRVACERFDPWGLAVEEERFEQQLRWLARSRQVLSLADFANRQRDGILPTDAVAVTFDDGYACAATSVVPLLEELNVPATIFLPARLIEAGREFWWDELALLIVHFPHEKLELLGDELQVPPKKKGDEEWLPGRRASTPRQKLFHHLWSRLRALTGESIDSALADLRSQARGDGRARESHRPLTRKEIRAMPASLVDFGSHALTHPSLPSLDLENKAREISVSVEACRQLTGKRPRSFAYPYGDVDLESERLVERAGFACGCTTRQAFVTATTNPFALPRLQVGNWKIADFANMLGGE